MSESPFTFYIVSNKLNCHIFKQSYYAIYLSPSTTKASSLASRSLFLDPITLPTIYQDLQTVIVLFCDRVLIVLFFYLRKIKIDRILKSILIPVLQFSKLLSVFSPLSPSLHPSHKESHLYQREAYTHPVHRNYILLSGYLLCKPARHRYP